MHIIEIHQGKNWLLYLSYCDVYIDIIFKMTQFQGLTCKNLAKLAADKINWLFTTGRFNS